MTTLPGSRSPMLVAYRTFGWFSRILRAVSVVIITGAAGGVGRACAQRFGAHHRLVLGDVAEGEGVVAGDVRDRSYVQRLVEQVEGEELATVICAAGLSSHMAS